MLTPAAALARARLATSRGGTLSTLMHRLAEVYGDRRLVEEPGGIALAGGAPVLSYREAAALIDRAAAVIAEKVPADRPAVIHGPNGYGFFLACLAASRAGRVFVPINPHMSEEEIDWVLEDAAGTRIELSWLEAVITGSEAAAGPGAGAGEAVRGAGEAGAVADVADGDSRSAATRGAGATKPDPDAVAAILYTSGTTGKPKGAMLTHRGLLDQPSRLLLWPTRKNDELVMALPVAHIMGFVVMLGAAYAGMSIYFLPRFRPPQVLEAIERRRSTAFIGVPAMYYMMLDAGAEARDLKSVRLWMSAADVMSDEVAQKFKKMGAAGTMPLVGTPFGEATFAEGYGMVELAGLVAGKVSLPFQPVSWGEFLGFPLPPYRLKVVDDAGNEVAEGEVGELAVAGPGVLRGYHRNDNATAAALTEDGWLLTGDLAKKGPLGLIQFAGRKKDVIKHGGYSVFPAEIEEVLRTHPAVSDAAVMGRPDPLKGQVPVAFLELAPGMEADVDALHAWAAEHLADYKRPKEIRVLEKLPRTGTGKVSRPELRALLESTAPTFA